MLTVFSSAVHSPNLFSGSQYPEQILIVLADTRISFPEQLDPAARMQHGRMVAATKTVTDLGQAVIGELLGQTHRNLSWPRYGTIASL